MLTRLEQLAIQAEPTENTAVANSSLFVANNMSLSVMDPAADFNLQVTERTIKRDTLTPLRPLVGQKFGMVKFGLEMAGNSAAITGSPGVGVPEIGLPLSACGFRQEFVVRITIGAVSSGPFKHGESVSQAVSLATGTVVGDTYTGQADLWVAQNNGLGSGTFNGTNLITGASSGASVTPTAVTSNAGVGWWPFSYTLTSLATSSIPTAPSVGDVVQGATSFAEGIVYAVIGTSSIQVRRLYGHFSSTENLNNKTTGATIIAVLASSPETQFQIPSLSMGGVFDGVRESIFGARGTVGLAFKDGQQGLLNFEFKGGSNGFTDGGLVPGVTFNQNLPSLFLNAQTQVSLDSNTNFANEFVMNISQADVAMANDVQYRQSANAATGLLETYIAARKPTLQMDPEYMPESLFGWMANFTGNINQRVRLRLGPDKTGGGAGSYSKNTFLISMPGLAITGVTPGDRNGLKTRQVSGTLTSGAQTSSTVLRENEIVIIYASA
jgi:hypothetical protein